MGKRANLRRGFYWRGDVIWVRTDPVDKKARSTKCSDPEAAYLWEAERQRESVNPAHAAAKKATIGGWVDETLRIKSAKRRKGTLHMYQVKLGHAERIFGTSTPMAAIDAPAVDAYIEQRRAEGAVDNTIARELSCIRQMLRYAKRAKQYTEDISSVMPVSFSANYKPVKRTLAREHVGILLRALRTDEQRAWVCLALAIGGDPVDVEAARSEDYDRARRVMMVHGTKNEARAAEVPILNMFREMFDYALPRLPVSWPNASNGLGRACKRAGIPHLSPKDLRRTASSWLMAAAADQSIVSRFLRHKSDAMVRKVYGQLKAEETGALLNRQTGAESLQLGQRDFGVCDPINRESSVFCAVAPPGFEPGRHCWRGILKAATRRRRAGETGWFGRKAAVGTYRRGAAGTSDVASWRTGTLQPAALARAAEALGLRPLAKSPPSASPASEGSGS